MKKVLISTILCLILILSSCNASSSYRDNVSCKNIATKMLDQVNSFGEVSSYSEDDVQLLCGSTSLFDELSVIYSTDANDINEIGIFHCKDEKSAKEFLTVAKGYINEQQENQRAFIASYAPREVPKLDSADVKRYGNYVIYTILGENAQREAFHEAKELLKKQKKRRCRMATP